MLLEKDNNVYINARFLTQKITGTQRFAIELCKELIKINQNIIFLSPRNVISTDLKDLFQVKIIGVTTGHLWEQIELPLYVSLKGGVLVNLVNTAPILIKNQIITIHDLGFIENPKWYSYWFSNFYKLLIPIILRRNLCILTVSNFSRCEILKYYKPNSKVYVISNALPNIFKSNDSIILSKQKYLLCVSSINPRKNFERIIIAFNMLKVWDYKLIIVGSKFFSFKSNLFDKYITSNIIWLDNVADEELYSLYRNATGFIYISLYEGFGIPLLEAQALGCPVLASNIPPHKEVLKDSALYCDPYSIDSISESIQLLLQDGTTMIEKGLINANRFSWKISAYKLSKLIHKYRSS